MHTYVLYAELIIVLFPAAPALSQGYGYGIVLGLGIGLGIFMAGKYMDYSFHV
jgi:hypothetical protein